MKKQQSRRAFTLIEMLVVIIIILVLSGLVLKISSAVFRNMAKAKALHDIQLLQSALTIYYTEYGMYPPVSSMDFQYECKETREALGSWINDPRFNTPGLEGFVDDKALGAEYGLVSYLWSREKGQEHWYNGDSERDKAVKAKMAPVLQGVPRLEGADFVVRSIKLENTITFSNLFDTINDPWNKPYSYESKYPYQKYRLASSGADGAFGTADDINSDSRDTTSP